MVKKEYRGTRSAESFAKFVVEQLKDPISTFDSIQDLQSKKVSLSDSSSKASGIFSRRLLPVPDKSRVHKQWKIPKPVLLKIFGIPYI